MSDSSVSLETINSYLHLCLSKTYRGDEAKGMCPDPDDGGTTSLYLDRNDCEVLSRAFAELAKELSVPGHVKLG